MMSTMDKSMYDRKDVLCIILHRDALNLIAGLEPVQAYNLPKGRYIFFSIQAAYVQVSTRWKIIKMQMIV